MTCGRTQWANPTGKSLRGQCFTLKSQVVDLEGNVLMEERLLAKYRKFESACVLPEHFH